MIEIIYVTECIGAASLCFLARKLWMLIKETKGRHEPEMALEQRYQLSAASAVFVCFVGTIFLAVFTLVDLALGQCLNENTTWFTLAEEASRLVLTGGAILFVQHIVHEEDPFHPYYNIRHGRMDA